MTDLWLVLLALFLLEGLGWAPRRSRILSRRPWGGYSCRGPVPLHHGSARGVVLPEPWAPALERFPAHAWPAAISPDGWAVRRRGASWTGEGVLAELGWSEAASLGASGSRLRDPRGTSVPVGSPRSARALAELLRELAAAETTRRATTIHASLARRFDSREARRRLRRLRRLLRGRATLSWVLTANLFLTAHVLGPWLGTPTSWLVALAVHAALTALVVTAYLGTTRRLGDLAPEERAGAVTTLLLYPPATARFLQAITREAMAGLDPLAVAAALLDREALSREVRARLAEIHDRPRDGAVVRWFHQAEREAIETLLRREALPAASILSRPEPQSGAGAYCPSCLAQYRSDSERCSDCPDVPLTAFDSPQAPGVAPRPAG